MDRMKTIQIRVKDVYGRETYYPVNEQAQHLARIANTRTLTRETLDLARKMGFTVETLARNPF